MRETLSPSRMELIRLREQLNTTKRGHKLLKDKQDEFIHRFVKIIKKYKELRIDVENKVLNLIKYYQMTLTKMPEDTINNYLKELKPTTNLKVSVTKLMGVELPLVDIDFKSDNNYDYNFLETTASFDLLLNFSNNLLEFLLNLAELETKVEKMIIEIEKSKRRVNAIENIVIKEIEEQIRVIRMKLSDLERSNTIRMMKSKEIITSKE